jgi:hypothetical protein
VIRQLGHDGFTNEGAGLEEAADEKLCLLRSDQVPGSD